jgi:flagellar export protein FliJ
MMKSRETLLRLKRFQVDEKRRKLNQIEMMIADFKRMAGDLDREIESEEARAGITDRAHFAYPTYARAAIQRRDNLIQSADDLGKQLEEARSELEEAFEELKKFEILDDREQIKEKAMEAVREQAEFDRIGAAMRFARA